MQHASKLTSPSKVATTDSQHIIRGSPAAINYQQPLAALRLTCKKEQVTSTDCMALHAGSMCSWPLHVVSLVLSLLVTASGNVIIFNEGQCDLAYFAVGGRSAKVKPSGVVHALCSSKLLGHLGGSIEVRRAHPLDVRIALSNGSHGEYGPTPESHAFGELLQTFDIPHHAPSMSTDPNYTDISFNLSYTIPYHKLTIKAFVSGWECTLPPTPEPADSRMAVLVLLACAATLLGSLVFGSASGSASRAETFAWSAIVIAYYITGVRQVYQASQRYALIAHEGHTSTNPWEGDKVWGLMGNTPWISSLFGGRRWDRKDLQLRVLAANFGLILAFVGAYLGLKWLLCRGEASQRRRPAVTLVLGLAFVGFLHEMTLLLPLACATLNFLLQGLLARLGGRVQALMPLVAWALALGSLAASGSKEATLASLLGATGQWMDGFKGEASWKAFFPLLVLRILSWSLDFHRSLRDAPKVEPSALEPAKREPRREEDDEERGRIEGHRSRQEYSSYSLYLAYLFYPPLYITGPIITFNAFASYMEAPQQVVVGRSLLIYWARLFFNMFLWIMFGHYLYVSALMMNGPMVMHLESQLRIFELTFTRHEDGGESLIWFSFWSLKWLWFKFLVIWRFSRAWALQDGVLSPENMNRCMCNNYTVRGFWRAWHRSFNRWLVRYIFVPLGGSRDVSVLRQCVNNGVVFTFVAVWHEPTMLFGGQKERRLLVWGWLFALFVLPELLAERFCRLPAPKAFLASRPLVARHLTALGGSCCVQMLILANLIGYSYGTAGIDFVLGACQNWGMILFLLAQTAWFSAKVQLMLLVRQREAAGATTMSCPFAKAAVGKAF
ncbi:unnamed protein product [Polarella glacialis]|uniref:Uncharacterized protein n=1 Tax=Polarella glacialis TaxID=89957 RepID=A0A813K6I5_POLGL|nr:unnamed protein product [Polarella glacialis]